MLKRLSSRAHLAGQDFSCQDAVTATGAFLAAERSVPCVQDKEEVLARAGDKARDDAEALAGRKISAFARNVATAKPMNEASPVDRRSAPQCGTPLVREQWRDGRRYATR